MAICKRSFTLVKYFLFPFFFFTICCATTCLLGAPPPQTDPQSQLSLLDAIVLGLVEGITEYLPVSSTGHLLLTQHLLGLTDTVDKKASSDAYAVIIQIGAILAVLGLYRQRARQILAGILGKDPQGLQLGLMLVLAFMPAAISGLMCEGLIKDHLFGPWPVALGWIFGGIAIYFVPGNPNEENTAKSKPIEDINWQIALVVGLFQIFALWPGVSRSLATVIGGLVAGLGLGAAVEFSFLLGLITLGAATVYEFIGSGGQMLSAYGVMTPAIGIICAFISAWVSVKWLVNYLKKHGLRIFAVYRICLGLLTLLLLTIHIL